MGNLFLDQYSLLHYASGVMAFHWGLQPLTFFLAHVAFEFAENSLPGMNFINENLTWWPGGKPHADSFLNMVGDNVSAAVGYWSAYYLDKLGKEYGWYEK